MINAVVPALYIQLFDVVQFPRSHLVRRADGGNVLCRVDPDFDIRLFPRELCFLQNTVRDSTGLVLAQIEAIRRANYHFEVVLWERWRFGCVTSLGVVGLFG